MRSPRIVARLGVILSVLVWCDCDAASDPIADSPLVCGSSAALASADATCGVGDANLPPEPVLPAIVCQTLTASKTTPDEGHLDTVAIQTALSACKGQGAVKLARSGTNDAFVSGHLTVDSTVLWVDAGVTLYASLNPSSFQSTDNNCGLTGISDSDGCLPLLSLTGTNPGVVGDGIVDGQGGEPLVGQAYSWWDLSGALRSVNGSAPNPALVEIKKATGALMYRITLHNSPKSHVKLSANPPGATCTTPGSGFIVWGVTILTPSKLRNSQGIVLSPYNARNTDGFDPGDFAATSCGVMACNTISTGDDQIAIKAGHGFTHAVIAHNSFGTGHGMSIGSETNGGVADVKIYDLTVDADSRWSGAPDSDTSDFNGIRVKSDESRGGVVSGITFDHVCTRDLINAIVVDSSYNPLFTGGLYPQFGTVTIQNFHAVTCMSLNPMVVDLQGFNAQFPAGPITLDNVVVDGVTALDVAAQFSSVTLGPGNVNFVPIGLGVATTNDISAGTGPVPCQFPTLPVPQ